MSDPAIEYLKTVDGPTLCNAIEQLHCRPNHEGFTPLDVRCLFPGFGRMAGYAVTAQVETVTQCEPLDLQHFVELYRLVERTPKPAVIAFQEVGAHPDYAAHCGEVMGTIFTRLGAIGLVSDCGVRDIPEVRNLGFHYFARGSVASHAHFRIARVGVTVQIRGMVVKPGQIVYGDENGVLTIPEGVQDRLPDAVERVRGREQKLMSFVRSSEFSLERFGEFVAE
jgi:regulator of RNase E activity RraA